jgi:hypothetical protein
MKNEKFKSILRLNFSAVFLSKWLDGGLNASGARQNEGPVMPKNTGNDLIVSIVIFARYLENLAMKNTMWNMMLVRPNIQKH